MCANLSPHLLLTASSLKLFYIFRGKICKINGFIEIILLNYFVKSIDRRLALGTSPYFMTKMTQHCRAVSFSVIACHSDNWISPKISMCTG